MGGKQSRGSPHGNLLEGTQWLRTVVQQHQKRRHHGGVSGYDSFVIEPFFIDGDGIEYVRVTIAFRNSKGKAQQVFWIVKAAKLESSSFPSENNGEHHAGQIVADASEVLPAWKTPVPILTHEIRVYTELLTEIGKFLMNKKNQRARYLLNVPDLIHHERLQQNGKIVRCHLVTEDVTETKRCTPVKAFRIINGLSLGQFKVLLGTLAQFHAVGIAWSLGTRDDSLLDLFPFLHKTTGQEEIKRSHIHLENYGKLLSVYFDDSSRQRKLFKSLLNKKDELFSDTIKQDMCDSLGSLCLGTPMPHEIMYQYETNFFDLCGVGGANIIWHTINEEDKSTEEDEQISPICAAVTTCHRVHYGHLLKELSDYFFLLPEPLIKERYIVFLLQSYCHVLTMTLEMLDVDWQKHFGELSFNKMVVAFYKHVPRAILQSVIVHMELTDPEQLDTLFASKKPPVIHEKSNQSLHLQKYIPLTPKRVQFLLSLMNLVHKSV